jgi:hypothetical protein
MKELVAHIDARTAAYAKLPLFNYLRDGSISASDRLAFAPCLTHFVMTFADMYALVLRDEPARDHAQELVNAHTHEDGGHWKWFLSDLKNLGLDPEMPFTEATRFLWGEATVATRMLSYRICRLGLAASSIQKLVLVHCIEATGKVSLQAAAPAGTELGQILGRRLVYLGAHHVETESAHTMEDEGVRRSVAEMTIDSTTRGVLHAVIDEAFEAFTGFADELLRFAMARRGRPGAGYGSASPYEF